jgi:hypothetical protein
MQFECRLVAGSGFGVLADLLMGMPEAVKRAGFSFLTAEVAEQVERLFAVADRLLVVPDFGAEPADRVEGLGLARPVADGRV